MATLTLKQVPEALYLALKERASAHRRSLNSEAIVCLEQALTPRPFNPRDWLAKARELRREASGVYLTDELLREAKDEGRP